MAQSHSNAIWKELAGTGGIPALVGCHLIDDGLGGYTIEDDSPTQDPVAARMLDDGQGGFVVTAGADNPGGLAELRMLDLYSYIYTY